MKCIPKSQQIRTIFWISKELHQQLKLHCVTHGGIMYKIANEAIENWLKDNSKH